MDDVNAKRIQEIEDEIVSVAHIEAKLHRFIRNGTTPEQRIKARKMLDEIDLKIVRLKQMMKALGKFDAELSSRIIQLISIPVPERTQPVKFYSIEEVKTHEQRTGHKAAAVAV